MKKNEIEEFFQKYIDKDVVWFIDKWFEKHGSLTKDNYEMFKEMICYVRRDKNVTQK